MGCTGLNYGDESEYVVKLKGGCEFGTSQLVRELAAAYLADYFGISHPPFALVEIEPDLAGLGARQFPEKGTLIEKSVGTNFGTKKMNGFTIWPIDRMPSPIQLDAACDVFSFDLLIRNPDRRFQNPNLGTVGEEIVVIDHELAFASQYELLAPRKPWQVADDEACTSHVFFNQLRKKAISTKAFSEKLAALPADFFDGILSELPVDWDRAAMLFIKDYMNEMKEHCEEFSAELIRRLS
jgi:hypothetical protein